MDRGLSCSDKDGFFWFGSVKFGDTFGGDLEELHKMVNLLTLCCLCGELKIMGLLVSERCPVKWTSRAVDKAVAMAQRERERVGLRQVFQYRCFSGYFCKPYLNPTNDPKN